MALPELIVPDLRGHLDSYVPASPDALIFTGEKGAMLKRSNWRNTVKWPESIKAAGLPVGFHFHDLRHTGNHLAASAGASTRELMHRMGHGSMRAALIYQHATSERDQEIAAELSRRASAVRKMAKKKTGKKPKKKGKSPTTVWWPNGPAGLLSYRRGVAQTREAPLLTCGGGGWSG